VYALGLLPVYICFSPGRNQSQDKIFDKYVTELKILASTCNYGALHDSLIIDRLICGINDSNLRERLLRVADLDLQKCLEICRAAKLSNERIKHLKHLQLLVWKFMLSNTKLDTHLNKTGNPSRNQNHLTMLIHNLHQHASIVAENTNTTKQNAPLLGRSVGLYL
jgi:hypothetical protein